MSDLRNFNPHSQSEDGAKYQELRQKWFNPDFTDIENLDDIRERIVQYMRYLNPDMTPEETQSYTDQINATQDDMIILQTQEALDQAVSSSIYSEKYVPTLKAAHGGIASINRLTRPLGY